VMTETAVTTVARAETGIATTTETVALTADSR
jgi:hypothetical protein